MAKAKNTKTVRERAIALWRKEYDPKFAIGDDEGWRVKVYKARSRKTITVVRDVPWRSEAVITWSYKGGTLRRIA